MKMSELIPDNKRAELILQWLQDKWKEPRTCPICKVNDWLIEGKLSQIPHYIHPNYYRDVIKFRYPSVLVICNNCGYTLAFNALIMRLVEAHGITGEL